MTAPPTTAPASDRAAGRQDAEVSVTLVDHPTLCHGFPRLTRASLAATAAREAGVDLVARLARGATTDQIADQMNTIAGSVAHAPPVP